MTEQPQEPSDTIGGGDNNSLQERLNRTARIVELLLWSTLEDDSDVYTVEDKPCGRCDEHHDVDNCGRDTADPDILYDEMHTLD
jgi:hypothetical protein